MLVFLLFTVAILHSAHGQPCGAGGGGSASGPSFFAVTVQTSWTAALQPVAYPSNAHFSPVIVVSHAASYNVFKSGELATPGVQAVAETGSPWNLTAELNIAIKQGLVLDYAVGTGPLGNVAGERVMIQTDTTRSMISVIAMIAPSPDWFIGYSFDSNNCATVTNQAMAAYDAGTDSGATFTAANSPTSPQVAISAITCGNGVFCAQGNSLNPLATLTTEPVCGPDVGGPPSTVRFKIVSSGGTIPGNSAPVATDRIDPLIFVARGSKQRFFTAPLSAAELDFLTTGNTTLLMMDLSMMKMRGLIGDYSMMPGLSAISGATRFSDVGVTNANYSVVSMIGRISQGAGLFVSGDVVICNGQTQSYNSVLNPLNPTAMMESGGAVTDLGAPAVATITPYIPCQQYGKFDVTFTGSWSAANQPLNYPAGNTAMFSPLVAVSANTDFALFQLGDLASAGMKEVAETGQTTMISSAINSAPVNSVLSSYVGSAAIQPPTGSVTFTVMRNGTNSLLSCATMIAPSPDWFTGVSQAELCPSSGGGGPPSNLPADITMMSPYDAGTDSGTTFTSANMATTPPQPISMISCGTNFCTGGGAVPSLGMLSFVDASTCSGSKTYLLQISTQWAASFGLGLGIPADPHFSRFVVASHSASYSMFAVGGTATTGVKNVAETGNSAQLVTELAAAKTAGSVLEYMVGLSIAAGAGTVYLKVTVDTLHPYVSFISMIAPSPDWFIGMSMRKMCVDGAWVGTDQLNVNAYDAGTDSGTTFTAANNPTSPAQAISRIMCDNVNFCTTTPGGNVQLAQATITGITSAMMSMNTTYYVEFTGTWTPAPGNPPNAHFSPFVITSHAITADIFQLAGMASAGVKDIAETGNVTLLAEALTAAGIPYTVTSPVYSGTGKTGGFVTVNMMSPLLSLIGMIAPSPDWFAGVNSYNALNGMPPSPVAVNAYDAGTDSGTTFTAANSPTSPQAPISRLACDNVNFVCSGNVQIGTFTFSPMCSGTRTYYFDFEPTWSAVNQPMAYPNNAHWSPIVVVSHGPGFSLFQSGQMATNGTKVISETGMTNELVKELMAMQASGQVLNYAVSAVPIALGTIKMRIPIAVDGRHPFVSAISMIAPSPDWFSGVSSENMCSRGAWVGSVTKTLFPYDAGTDSGTLFNSANSVTTPQAPISQIMCNGVVFCAGGGQVMNFGSATLTTTCTGSMTYDFEMIGKWTPQNQPGNFPTGMAKFSPPVIVSHSRLVSLFSTGMPASETLKAILNGSMTQNVGSMFKTGAGLSVGSATVTMMNPLVSVVSKVVPSPDWFVAALDIDMCNTATGQWKPISTLTSMMAYDAGLMDGTAFTTPGNPTSANVMQLMCANGNFCAGNGAIPTLAEVSLGTGCSGRQWYTVEFCGGWNYHAQPLSPPNLHFSPMVVAGHYGTFSIFENGGYATPGLKTVAETGMPTTLQGELMAQTTASPPQVCSMVTAPPFPSMIATGQWPVGDLYVDTECHFFSAVTMLAPSPDWFTGAGSIDMCNHTDGTWLQSVTYSMTMAYDAGTDSGATFTAANSATTPQGNISMLMCDGTNFCAGGGAIPSLGTIVITARTPPTKMPTMTPSMMPSTTPSKAPTAAPAPTPNPISQAAALDVMKVAYLAVFALQVLVFV